MYRAHEDNVIIICVHNDIVRAIDEKRIVGLVLLDLSAAFDTVDHSTLLSVLQQRFGVNDVALAWLQLNSFSSLIYFALLFDILLAPLDNL